MLTKLLFFNFQDFWKSISAVIITIIARNLVVVVQTEIAFRQISTQSLDVILIIFDVILIIFDGFNFGGAKINNQTAIACWLYAVYPQTHKLRISE